MSNYTALS